MQARKIKQTFNEMSKLLRARLVPQNHQKYHTCLYNIIGLSNVKEMTSRELAVPHAPVGSLIKLAHL